MKKNILVLVLFLSCFVFSGPVQAQELEGSSSDQEESPVQKNEEAEEKKEGLPNKDEIEKLSFNEMRLVALVSAGNLKIEEKGGNNFEISFDILNQEGIQPYVKYAINLVKKDGDQETVLDRKIYDEVLNIGNGEIIHRALSYEVPEYLKSGNYALFLEARNKSGLRLAYISAGEINLSGGESKIEIGDDSCGIFFGDVDLRLSGKIPSQDDLEKPNLRCKIKNIYGNKIEAYLGADICEKSYFSDLNSRKMSEKASLNPDEEREFRIDLEGIDKIKSPMLTISVFSGEDRQISRIVNVPYFGSPASLFYNTRLDKDYYLRNETAKIIFDIRPFYPKGSVISYSLEEKNGQSCLEEKKREKALNNSGIMKEEEKIAKDCFDFTLHVFVKDKDGNILDEEKYFIESRSKEAKEKAEESSKNSRRNNIIILSFLIIVFLSALGFSFYKKIKFRNIKFPLFLFFVFGVLFLAVPEAKAATYVYTDDMGTFSYSCHPNYGTAHYGNKFTVNTYDNIPPRDGNTTYYYPDDGRISFSASVERESLVWDYGCWRFYQDYYDYLSRAAAKTYDVEIGAHTESDEGSLYSLITEESYNYFWLGGYRYLTILDKTSYGDMWSRNTTLSNTANFIFRNGNMTLSREYDFPMWIVSIGGKIIAQWVYNGTGSCGYRNCKGNYEIIPVPKCRTTSSGLFRGYWDANVNRYLGDPFCYNGTSYEYWYGDWYYECTGTEIKWSCNGTEKINCSYPLNQGVCGSAIGVASATKPVSNLCSVGTGSAILSGDCNSWIWTCGENNEGFCSQKDCSAPVIHNLCSGTVPLVGNFEKCPEDGVATNPDNSSWQYASSCSTGCTRSCEYKCKPGFIFDESSRWPNIRCIVPYCTGSNNFPNAYFCPGSDTGLSRIQYYGLYSSCGSNKCAYACNSGYFYYSGACRENPKCGSAAGVPTCNQPSGAGLCTSPSSFYTNTGISQVSGNWQWYCISPYSYRGNPRTLCTAPVSCSSPSCGSASHEDHCVSPSSDLCVNNTNTPTVDSSNSAEFKWTCSNSGGSVDCSARKYCSSDAIWKEVSPD